jgi:exopolysaccharide production protein ExoZ
MDLGILKNTIRQPERKKYFSATLEKEKKHLGHIESLRALAALIVLVFHFISFSDDAKGPLIKNELIRKYSEFGAQGVELFYIISGFVIYYSLTSTSFGIQNYPKYLLKRFARIFPPFLGTLALICVIALIWKGAYPYTFKQVLENASLSVDLFNDSHWMNPIFVTLKVEFLFYLVIGLLVIPLSRAIWSYALITFSVLIAVYYFNSIDLVHNAPFFLIGIACSEIYRSRNLVLNYVLIAACFVILCSIFPPEDVVVSLIGVVFLLWITIKSEWLESIGHFSYSLYLTHGFSGGLFLYYSKNQTHVDWNPWVYFTLAVLGAIVFAYGYYLVIEKRSIRWSKRIRY